MSFTYPESDTLKNLENITDYDMLESHVARVVSVRAVQLDEGRGPAPTFDKAHLQALHKHLFQDVFEWAGELRHQPFTFADGSQASMPTMQKRGGKGFAVNRQIETGLNSLMSDLQSRDLLRGLDRETFTSEAADAFARLNSIHPFREGNGRTQRAFFEALGEQAGHPLDFGVISAERMTVVSIAAHEDGDLAPMRRMFAEIADPERVNALEVAQRAIEKFRPAQAPHVTSWDGIYMATTEAGEGYHGRFTGAAGPNFMMQRYDGSIIVGNVIDLPEHRPQSGDEITFIASGLSQQVQNLSPLISAVQDWPQSVSQTVAERIETLPEVRTFRADLAKAVAAVWQDPQAVLAELQRRIEVERRPVSEFAQEIRNSPQSLGELHGTKNLFGRADAAREKAIDMLPLAVAAMHDYGKLHHAMTADLTRDEERFRQRMSQPVNDLSPQAQTLVRMVENVPSHALSEIIARGEYKNALQELRGFVEDIQTHFKAHDGSKGLDRERLSQVLPNLPQHKIHEFCRSVACAETIGSRASAIEQANSQTLARSHSHEQSPSKGFEI
ncbi:BID domain-containing protein [Ochrobactrum sp. MR28]|nr:BID domain-containing protein [Ochrobactrum sp. MR28]MBX8818032.1 BID domain-containing protein [Ochrobactrum sp. MR31]